MKTAFTRFLVFMGVLAVGGCDHIAPGLTRILDLIGVPVSVRAIHEPAPRLQRLAGSQSSIRPTIAPFFGNLSAVSVSALAPANDVAVLARQADCSLTFLEFTLGTNADETMAVATPDTQLPHYEMTLRQSAFLTTPPGGFSGGCADQLTGNTSRLVASLGVARTGRALVAVPGSAGVLTSGVLADGTFTRPVALATSTPPQTVVGADLDKDGNPDAVSVDTDGLRSSVTVFLGKADGSFAAGVELALPGFAAKYAVIDDLDGDGTLDVLASSAGQSFAFTVFIGNGDGTFKAGRDLAPAGNTLDSSTAFITADVNHDGAKDIVAANGQVFLNAGNGVDYTLVAQPAFARLSSGTSSFAPQIVAADFGHRGKLDLAIDDGAAIHLAMGNGDGTFAAGPAYATIADFGFLVVTDLDGDGNLDLWSGYGGGVGYAGSDSDVAYALMGNGDGTFQGAPSVPALYNGANLVDLNGDTRADLVGVVSGQPSKVVTYLAQGNGLPIAGPALDLPAGVSVDSFAIGEVTGDSRPDLVFVTPAPQVQSFYLAAGAGDGSFGTPVATPTPSLVPSGIDLNETITGVRLADLNHDGKADLIYSFSDQDSTSQLYTQGFAVQLGNGNGGFAAPSITTTYSSANPPQIFFSNQLSGVADVTRDDFPDVLMVVPNGIVSGTAQHQVLLFVGNGDGTFKAGSVLALTGNTRAADPANGLGSPFAIADLNGDGKPDLVAGGSSADGTMPQLAVALGNGDGSFQPPALSTFAGFGYVYSPAVADFDGDGKLDVFVNVLGQGAGIVPGDGAGGLQPLTNADGTVTAPEAIALAVSGAAAATDLNGDGKPDLIVGGVVMINKTGLLAPTQAATTVTLTAAPNPTTPGTSVAFTATVTSASAGTITGTVVFSDGATSLGTTSVGADGVATLATAALAAGSHAVTATYGGDATFAASASTPLAVVVGSTASFSVAVAPSSVTVTPSQAATAVVTVTPASGFDQAVQLSCLNLPAGVGCAFSPPSVTPAGGPGTTTLTLTEVAASGVLDLTLFLGGALMILLFAPRRRRLAPALLVALVACSSSPGPGSTGAKLTIVATGPDNQTATATLEVNVQK